MSEDKEIKGLVDIIDRWVVQISTLTVQLTYCVAMEQ